ncbi:hypothetical protein CJF31_00001188 [Rutstroemia sp. NJR-2017a BVV2]|nr:hypothetical protein CJF31_00001188 [Rutstroemia sp. NJR-2017a BVV2]
MNVNIRSDSKLGGCGQPSSTPKPVLLLSVCQSSTKDTLIDSIESFYSQDDVFSDDFLTDVVVVQFQGEGDKPVIPWSELSRPTSTGRWVPEHVIEIGTNPEVPQGPYFLHSDNTLTQAWRLYADTQDAFATTFVPVDHGSSNQGKQFHSFRVLMLTRTRYEPLNATGDGIRLYTPVTQAKLLAGKRISVKDNFKVSGIKTTQSNRAFVGLYGPDTETSPYLQRLLILRAVLVGKAKMTAFVSAEEATDQWIDFHAPFNPRADGYQTPLGSTTGGASALAAYEWLDFSVGTDTSDCQQRGTVCLGDESHRAQIRSKVSILAAGMCKINEEFPSHVLNDVRAMDTLGFLTRDMDELRDLVKYFLPSLEAGRKRATSISSTVTLRSLAVLTIFSFLMKFYFFPHSNPDQQKLVDEFVSLLERFLGIKRTHLSISERWNECPPNEAEGKGIREYLDKFEMTEVTNGDCRDRGAQVTLDNKNRALKEFDVYRRWFQENIMKPGPNGSSSAIMILPCGSGEPKYRNLPNPAPGMMPAFSPNYIASVLGLPQVVVPIGQIPFESRISKRTEYLPTVGSIAGAPGSDLMLVDLVKAALKK